MTATFVTGGAGFIGTELVRRLLIAGGRVTVFDDLSTAEPDWREAALCGADNDAGSRLRFLAGDVLDLPTLTAAMAAHDTVVHLAANTDIAGGFAEPRLDLDGCVIGSWNVFRAMHTLDIRRVWYASSGVVYGRPSRIPTAEGYGPLQPESHYAAGKLAGESLLSGFAHLYGWRAIAFRFGNTVGPRSNHGVVHDLVVKLVRDPSRLPLLGDGNQRKPYIAVEDVVEAMLHAAATSETPMEVYNVATSGTLSVIDVAGLAIDALGLPRGSVTIEPQPVTGGGGWRGDTPLVALDTTSITSLGWHPRMTAAEAVSHAARGAHARLRAPGARLLTAAERRASPALVPMAQWASEPGAPATPVDS